MDNEKVQSLTGVDMSESESEIGIVEVWSV